MLFRSPLRSLALAPMVGSNGGAVLSVPIGWVGAGRFVHTPNSKFNSCSQLCYPVEFDWSIKEITKSMCFIKLMLDCLRSLDAILVDL